MNKINYVAVSFSFMTMSIILMGSLMNSFEKYLPVYFKQTFRYGKFAYKGKGSYVKPIEVPKSWFKHFYVYSSILSCLTLILMIATLVFGFSLPSFTYFFLDYVGGFPRQAHVSNAAALLAMLLLTLQSCRRMYDTHFVSIFGKKSYMNISHYFVGFAHYTGAVVAILLETPKFVRYHPLQSVLRWQDLHYIDYAATLLFLWAWWHQHKVTVILANLRKDETGKIVTQEHKLPHGDWFKYVSSPHLLAEILMYFSLTIILWNNITWLYVFAWVLSNQVETALLSHWWYQETFKDLPARRKAIIPFIY